MSQTHTTARATGRTQAVRLVRLRLSSLGAVVMLMVEFILGVIYNLYGTAPTSTKSIGLFSSPDLALHVVLGILLVVAAVGQLVRAIGVRHRLSIWLSAVGLLAILGAGSAAVGTRKVPGCGACAINHAHSSAAVRTGATIGCTPSA